MMKRNQVFLPLMCAFIVLLLSCNRPSIHHLSTNIWVGSSQIMDRTIPYPYFLEWKDSVAVWRNHYGEILDSCTISSNLAVGDNIKMNDHWMEIMHLEPGKLINIFQLKDTAHFPYVEGKKNFKYRAQLVPVLTTEDWDLQATRSALTRRTFYADVPAENPNDHLVVRQYITFENDTMETRLDYYYQDSYLYSEYQRQKYVLFKIHAMTFISCNNTDNNPQPIIQIVDIDGSGMQWRSFINGKSVITTMKSAKKPVLPSKLYSNCYDGHVGEYYHNNKDVTYGKGNEYIIKEVNVNAPKATGSGFIIVHFNVNCHGECGRPGLLMMDKAYKSTVFATSLVQHIITFVMRLRDWPSSVSDLPTFPYKDVHGFLMFKIENGKITDLCP